MSFQDAFVLAGILGHPDTTRENLPRALQAYQHVRLPFANRVLAGSFESGRMYEYWHDSFDVGGSEGLQQAIIHQWDWVGSESPEQQMERALQWMHNEGNVVNGVDVETN